MLTEFGAREGRCPKPTPSGTEETADETSVPTSPGYLPDFPAKTGSVSKPVSAAGFRLFSDLNQFWKDSM